MSELSQRGNQNYNRQLSTVNNLAEFTRKNHTKGYSIGHKPIFLSRYQKLDFSSGQAQIGLVDLVCRR